VAAGIPDSWYLPPEGYPAPPEQPPKPPPSLLARILAPLTAVGFFLLKFGKLALLALKGGKFAGTAITMIISIGAYSLFFGWPFAAIFVLLLLVHEMGHVIQLKREGIDASAPMFIPFLGAAVAMREMPRNALVEARVGLAGPILGTVGGLVVYGMALQYHSDLLMASAFTAFFLNLFNLLPICAARWRTSHGSSVPPDVADWRAWHRRDVLHCAQPDPCDHRHLCALRDLGPLAQAQQHA